MKRKKKNFGLRESLLLDILVAIQEAKAQGESSFEENLSRLLRSNGDLASKVKLNRRGYQIVKKSIPRAARSVVKKFFLGAEA